MQRPASIDDYTWRHIDPAGQRMGVITVTPALATHLRLTKGHNRRIRPVKVARIGATITDGRFINQAGGALLLDAKGQLRGAQHRCSAVELTGLPIRLIVKWDQTEDEIAADNEGGTPWSANDIETVDLPHKAARSAITLNLLVLDHFGEGRFGEQHRWAPDKLLVAQHMSDPRIMEAASVAEAVRKKADIITSAVGTVYATAVQSGRGDPDDFFTKLRTGAGMQEGDPVLTVRNLLAGRDFATVRTTYQTMYVLTRAWNAVLRGQQLRRMFTYDKTSSKNNNTPIAMTGWVPFF
jgi:hypothetical protein